MSEESGNFTVENKHRTCRITAHGTTFYVNGHFLGEISTFFDVAFFGEFAEAREKLITLESETPQDIALFLDIVHPGGKKSVTEKSCGLMMRYSDIWDIPSLRDKCKDFLLYSFPRLRASFETTLALLEIAYLHGFEHCSDQLISRLAGFGQVFLDQQGMLHKITVANQGGLPYLLTPEDETILSFGMTSRRNLTVTSENRAFFMEFSQFTSSSSCSWQITDARTVAALFSAAPKEKIVVKKFLHCLTSLGNRNNKECVILNCTSRPSHVCTVCKLYLCSAHQDYIPCTKDAQFPNFIKIVPFNIGSAKVDTDLLYGKNNDK